jgi:hypothetical protein
MVSVRQLEEIESDKDDSAQTMEVARPSIRMRQTRKTSSQYPSALVLLHIAALSNGSMGSSRPFHSKTSGTPKKAVKVENIMNPGLMSSSPLSYSRYNEHEPGNTEASVSRFEYYNNTCSEIPRISIHFQNAPNFTHLAITNHIPTWKLRSSIPMKSPKSPNIFIIQLKSLSYNPGITWERLYT